ncbi:jg27208, partial [Pararge aegeria aegeria]
SHSPIFSIHDYSPKPRNPYFDAKLEVFNPKSKSLASSPFKIDLAKCFELRKLSIGEKLHDKWSSPSLIEENLSKIFPKRRSSTPSAAKPSSSPKRISEFRKSVKTDSENDDAFKSRQITQNGKESEVLFSSPENFLITKTAPSVEAFGVPSVDLTTSSDDMESCRLVFFEVILLLAR